MIEYCSLNSINSDEKIFATASHFTKLLLVEYNFPWAENPLLENQLSVEVNNFLNQINNPKSLTRVLFIKNKIKSKNLISVFAINNIATEPFTNYFSFSDYNSILNINEREFFSAKNQTRFDEPLYLVCTNGKKDKCCSKFGIPIYKQLLLLNPNVWECTHVGGDRFAPNVIHLPYCYFYGQLSINSVNEFYLTTSSKKIFTQNLRGRSAYNKKSQAAEFFLRKELDDNNFESTKIVSIETESGNEFAIKFFYTPLQRHFIVRSSFHQTTEKYFLTCNGKRKHPKTIFKLVSINETPN